MGLVSSKCRELGAGGRNRPRGSRRPHDCLPLEQLAISTQCGFASVIEGNEIDEDTQWRKLDLVARVADRVWGR